jgi:hypothetical protein
MENTNKKPITSAEKAQCNSLLQALFAAIKTAHS